MTRTYSVIPLQVSLPLDLAERIAATALAAGREHGLLPLAVAVLDAGAGIVLVKREDGCGVLRCAIAIGKAAGALGMGVSSRTIRDRLRDRPAFQSAIAVAAEGRFMPAPGGVLVLDGGGAAIGAVGVSGDTSDRDEYVAIAAILAVGMTPDPSEPAEGWRDSTL